MGRQGREFLTGKLNPAQQQAVAHFQGPMMVLAGPGSGKTKVITHRVCHLIEEKGVNPANILVITFTKAAAEEMRQRYQRLTPAHSAPVQFGTFHAVFFTILKHAYHYTPGNIIRDDVRRQVLKEIIDTIDLEIMDENDFIQEIGAEISRVKNSRIDLEKYCSPSCPDKVFCRIFHRYQNALERRRLIDFDDMLVYSYELLSQRPDILSQWQRKYPYILIDEFQDINQIQFDVVRLLARPGNHLFVVGDDDQSIYGFRGARPDIMRKFVQEYDPEQCTLNINYRCAGEIVRAAGKLIAHNKNRLPKEILPVQDRGFASQDQKGEAREPLQADSPQKNDVVSIRGFDHVTQQNEVIREEIALYHDAGIHYSEIAVLFRTNTQARAISTKLKEAQIPFVMKETVPNLYEHWIAQDILSYIRVAGGNRERGQVMRIINRPKRYVHRMAFSEPYVDWRELEQYYEDKSWMLERLEDFQKDLSLIAGMRPYAAVNFIRRGVGYDEYIQEYADGRGIQPDGLYEILDELQEASKAFWSSEQWFAHIQAYGEEMKEQAEKSRQMKNGRAVQEDAVMLMTMHGAKGLEYECVFIPDANEGITPHNKAALEEELEEERRMFYVAMTRARNHLHIYYSKERFNRETSVSRFVEELQE